MTSTITLYPDIVFETTPPDEYDEEVDATCEAIRDACAGWGTDEGALIEVVGSLSPTMRYLATYRYDELYEKDLRKVMKSECGSGDFGLALQLMTLPSNESECMMLNRAMQGIGARERIIWPIICGRNNEDIELLKRTYFDMYDKDLGVQLASELGGDFERLIFHCLQSSEDDYDEDFHTDELAEEAADVFYEAGEGKWGTDEKSLFEIISKAPPPFLEKINDIYIEKNECTLISALESELGGDVEKGALHVVGMKLKPFETMAHHIKSTCAGFGTDELGLTCCLVRYQPYLAEANEAHIDLFDKSIQERIESEVSGDYKKLLLKIVDTVCENAE